MVGIGGAGMCGIAEVLVSMGFEVSGSDLQHSDVTERLESMGVRVCYEHNAEQAAGADVVVFSSAVRPENAEVRYARENRIPTIPRSEMLGELMRLKRGIAISGTHGKTTTTSMIGQLFAHAGLAPTVIVGGKVRALGTGAATGTGEFLVAEADEFDRSFLRLSPTLAVITTIEAEHLDTYLDLESIKDAFVEFANKVPFYGLVVACADDPHTLEVLPRIKRPLLTYGRAESADFRIVSEEYAGLTSAFEVVTLDRERIRIELQVPGAHNVLNATAAVAIALETGLPVPRIQSGLREFTGVHRRFEFKGELNDALIFDDYAHHPTEVRVTLETARRSWPDRRLVAAFQPHLFTRTRDFASEFADSLSIADRILLLDIYPSRERPLPNVTSELVAAPLRLAGKDVVLISAERCGDQIAAELRPNDVLIAMGAGSISGIIQGILPTHA
ncbi:MAG: UDP-N-acetylmuramate--L-alanine ligase [bacterium]|nr:UDP-N-acetylmuramate--L-alanine ligase [bacterium]